jgi:hypothetical protein
MVDSGESMEEKTGEQVFDENEVSFENWAKAILFIH